MSNEKRLQQVVKYQLIKNIPESIEDTEFSSK